MKKRKKLSDATKIIIARWYLAGALYFFLAFGTPLGGQFTTIDLTLVLAMVMGMLTVFVFDPIIWRVFDVTVDGKNQNEAYFKQPQHVAYGRKLLELVRCMVTVFLVTAVYQWVNIAIVKIGNLPEGTVVWKGEPFLFATVYTVLYVLTDKILLALRRRRIAHAVSSVDDR